MRPFDFQLFLRILAANEMSLMQDDEPIFIVGPTRVGKVSVLYEELMCIETDCVHGGFRPQLSFGSVVRIYVKLM